MEYGVSDADIGLAKHFPEIRKRIDAHADEPARKRLQKMLDEPSPETGE